jgi:hypothetical protein
MDSHEDAGSLKMRSPQMIWMIMSLTIGSTVPMAFFTSSTHNHALLNIAMLSTIRFLPFSFHPPLLCNPFSPLHNVLFHLRNLPTLLHHIHNHLRNVFILHTSIILLCLHIFPLQHPLFLLCNPQTQPRNRFSIIHFLLKLKTTIIRLVAYRFLLCTYLHSLLLCLFSIEI